MLNLPTVETIRRTSKEKWNHFLKFASFAIIALLASVLLYGHAESAVQKPASNGLLFLFVFWVFALCAAMAFGIFGRFGAFPIMILVGLCFFLTFWSSADWVENRLLKIGLFVDGCFLALGALARLISDADWGLDD